MAQVIYINDIKYSLKDVTLEQLAQWPHSQLLKYHLDLKKLTTEDLKIISSSEYNYLIQKHTFTTNKAYARSVYTAFAKKLVAIPIAITLIGFLFGYFTYFQENAIFSTINYLTIFYVIFSASIYFASFFSLQIVTEQIFINKLTRSGRLLFTYELTKGLTSKFFFAWLIIQIWIQIIMWFISTT